MGPIVMTISHENPTVRWRQWTLAFFCVLAILFGHIAPVSAADIHVAGLIVDYGDGRISYAWVPFTEDEISGVDLLERSGLDVVTVSFGGMGDAVCEIDDTGCPVGDCRKRMCQTSDPESPFWRYSRQVDGGDWAFSATGASGAKVRDGDVDAWVWSGTDVDLPAMTIGDIAKVTRADTSSLENAAELPPARVVTEGSLELGNDDADLRQQIGPTVVIVVVAGFAVWWVRRRQAAPR